MLLEKLTISGSSGVIRDIPFKLKGMNLIIDSTPRIEGESTISGNNVGKTTFIRCIDFCLGSSGKDIYQDRETKVDNIDVKNFLFDNKIQITLALLKKDGSKIILRRSFDSTSDLFINNDRYKDVASY